MVVVAVVETGVRAAQTGPVVDSWAAMMVAKHTVAVVDWEECRRRQSVVVADMAEDSMDAVVEIAVHFRLSLAMVSDQVMADYCNQWAPQY